MKFNFLGKEIRGCFGFPPGVIAVNSDTARWMLNNIPQLGFYIGKSTTIEPKEGNCEDVIVQESFNSLRNAVGYTNPGLEATIESFYEIKESVSNNIFLMSQIGESNEERFAHCVSRFDKTPVDGIELNLSCPHAKNAGILIGSDPQIVHSIVAAARKATKKPLIVKLNAGVLNIEEIAKAAVDAGANAISAINTLGGPNTELYNKFGGLSGSKIFPITYDTVKRIRRAVNVPMSVMGGISSADNIRKLKEIDNNFVYAIGTALKGLNSEEVKHYFKQLEIDLENGTNDAKNILNTNMLMDYKPFVVKDVVDFTKDLRLIEFYENLEADPGQFVFLKIGNHAKPFSVANDNGSLEILVKRKGNLTSKTFDLKKNSVVRIRGPYGNNYMFSKNNTTVFVGAGCGIAPIHHAVTHNNGNSFVVIGANTSDELVYLDGFRKRSKIAYSTDDGSAGYKGYLTDLLDKKLKEWNLKNIDFFNCGPEIMLKKADEIERRYTSPDKIYHLVERITSCGIGICGKCSISNGKRVCVDGPWFDAIEFKPEEYSRDKTGKKIYF